MWLFAEVANVSQTLCCSFICLLCKTNIQRHYSYLAAIWKAPGLLPAGFRFLETFVLFGYFVPYCSFFLDTLQGFSVLRKTTFFWKNHPNQRVSTISRKMQILLEFAMIFHLSEFYIFFLQNEFRFNNSNCFFRKSSSSTCILFSYLALKHRNWIS